MRQNFLSKDFFVSASENATKQVLMSIPQFVDDIKYVGENTLVQTMKFMYNRQHDDLNHHVDVSLLPLSDGYTRITLHGTYANGQAFHKDEYISNALNNFESAINAAIKGEIAEFKPEEPKPSSLKRVWQMLGFIVAAVGISFILKKFS